MHQCGGSSHPKVHALICLRQGYALHKIALGINQGAFGDADLFPQGHHRFLHNADNVSALPNWGMPFVAFKA